MGFVALGLPLLAGCGPGFDALGGSILFSLGLEQHVATRPLPWLRTSDGPDGATPRPEASPQAPLPPAQASLPPSARPEVLAGDRPVAGSPSPQPSAWSPPPMPASPLPSASPLPNASPDPDASAEAAASP